MTQDAATLLRALSQAGGGAPEGGVRIVINRGTDSLSMGLADHPELTDAVVTRGDSRLFLSEPAARRMRGQTLCAEIKPARSVFFLRSD